MVLLVNVCVYMVNWSPQIEPFFPKYSILFHSNLTNNDIFLSKIHNTYIIFNTDPIKCILFYFNSFLVKQQQYSKIDDDYAFIHIQKRINKIKQQQAIEERKKN